MIERLVGEVEILLAVGAGFGGGFILFCNLKCADKLIVPFFKKRCLSAREDSFFITLSYFVIVGTSNAVNLTDGFGWLGDYADRDDFSRAFVVFAYVTGHSILAKYLFIPYVAGRW